MKGSLHFRSIEFDATADNKEEHSLIPCTIATQTPVQRFGASEVLDCSAAGVDLSRAPLPLIVSHDANQLSIGLVENLQALGDRVVGEVRFGTSPEAQQVRADVVAGIHRNLSIGYVHLDEGTPIDGGLLFRWMPYEVSIVSVPADPQAGFFRSLTPPAMNTSTPVSNEIQALCTRHGLPELSSFLIRCGASVDHARAAVLDELDRRSAVNASGPSVSLSVVGNVHSQEERSLILNTMISALGGKPSGEIIRSSDFAGLAHRTLVLAGQSVAVTESRDRIIRRAMQGTGDFPRLLGDAVGRVLHGMYAEVAAPLKSVARLANLPDFRARSVVRVGGAPDLEPVNEHGEYKRGVVSDTANGWSLTTYGRILALTRQAMVNDDLQAFSTLIQKFAQAAARREADELAKILVSSPVVDGAPLFHADRSSLISTQLTIDGLSDAVEALRKQKEVDGGLVLQEPSALVVPASLEMKARQLVASFVASTAQDVQPYTLSVVVEPRLDAVSKTGWYLVSNSQPALEYGYLDGAQGVQIVQREGFEVDGLEMKASLDFGCGWVSPIGWVKSTGTS